jgi:hypothetical protein
MASEHKSDVIGIVKEWAAPILISILGMFIWRDLTELREDVKFLVKEQGIGTVKITVLETRVALLENDLKNITETLYRLPMYAIKEEDENGIRTKRPNSK